MLDASIVVYELTNFSKFRENNLKAKAINNICIEGRSTLSEFELLSEISFIDLKCLFLMGLSIMKDNTVPLLESLL